MAISPTDLLTLAKQLNGGATESEQRAATSRAYYAAFHHAWAWHEALPAAGHAPNGMGEHVTLIRRLNNPDGRISKADQTASRKLSRHLDALRIRRRSADYFLADPHTKAMADLDVLNGERILANKWA